VVEISKSDEGSSTELDPAREQPTCPDVLHRFTYSELEEDFMNTKLLAAVTIAAALSFPVTSQAQNGVAAGATTGAVTGAIVGGPVGAAVGAGAGAIAGGIAEDSRPRFRSYVSERHVPSYRYDREVRIGEDLPSSGVTYYDVPREYGVTNYRYTVVNDRTVLVDPSTHRIVQVIE
jgi:hypothetical protein